MLTLTRRTLIATLPTIALFPIKHSEAAIQPAILQNDLWQRPGTRDFADRLRGELLSRPIACLFIGTRRSPGTAKYPLSTCYTMEMAYDGLPPKGFVDDLAWALARELADDLARHRELFCHGQPIPLVALDGSLAIDINTFQPMIRFYMEWNGTRKLDNGRKYI